MTSLSTYVLLAFDKISADSASRGPSATAELHFLHFCYPRDAIELLIC